MLVTDIKEISISKLYVSDLNVRKTLLDSDEESTIFALSKDIEANGLLNPITVRKNGSKYEIIAGQRRFIAMKMLGCKTITCNIKDVSKEQAEVISIIENIHRSQMTTYDKMCAYVKIYDTCNGNIDEVLSKIHVVKSTLQKYLKIRKLPKEVLLLLDSPGDDKISLDVALELAAMPANIDVNYVVKKIDKLKNTRKVVAIKNLTKKMEKVTSDKKVEEMVDEIMTNFTNGTSKSNYICDQTTKKKIIIPHKDYDDVIKLLKEKNNGEIYYI